MKILFHYDAGEQLLQDVQAAAQGLNIVCCPEGPRQPFLSELADAEVIWHVLQAIDKDVIDQAPELKLIQKIGVGVNTIDLEAAKARGIAVCNMPGTNSRAVAEMTLMLMLQALRKTPILDQACRSGRWYLDACAKESLGEIGGKTVGLVGFGAIAQLLAPMLEAMGARVIYTARSEKSSDSVTDSRNHYQYCELNTLLAQADIVSLHVPLTDSTEHLIDSAAIAQMKTGAILVNTARGRLVDEYALYNALSDGKLSAAGLDVFAAEPAPRDNALLSLNNVVVSPHIAWLTNETWERSISVAVENSLAIAENTPLRFRVV
jgi:phosphoglycerate dehydrogenase-like enzyme